MIALLRYFTLKSVRDRSLITFIAFVVLVPTGTVLFPSLIGSVVPFRHAPPLRYPFSMSIEMSPAETANTAGEISTIGAMLLATLPAFWILRLEIASRSVGSLICAARPMTIIGAVVAFASGIAVVGWIVAMIIIVALTASLPAHIARFAGELLVFTVAQAAVGALSVTISLQPAMVVAAYFGYSISFLLVLKESKISLQLVVAAIVAMICVATSAFLLERRWAT